MRPIAVALEPPPARAVDLAAEAADRAPRARAARRREGRAACAASGAAPRRRASAAFSCRRRWRSRSASSSSGIARRMSSACAVTAWMSSSSTPISRRSSTSSASAGAGRSIGSSSAPVSDAMPPGVNERARLTRSWWVTRESASCSASGLRWRTRFWPKTERRSRSVSPWTSCDGRSWSSGRKRRRSTACVSSSAWLRSSSRRVALEVLAEAELRRRAARTRGRAGGPGRPAAARAAGRRTGRTAGRRSRRPRCS